MPRPRVTMSRDFEPTQVMTAYQRRRWRAIYAIGVLKGLGHSAAFIADALSGIDHLSERQARRLMRARLLSDPRIQKIVEKLEQVWANEPQKRPKATSASKG